MKQLGSVKLTKPSKRLCGADQRPLQVLGEVQPALFYKKQSCTQTFYVVKQMPHNLLGLPAIKALQVVTLVN